MTQLLINLQFQILTYMIVGFILKKVNIIDGTAQSFLSEFVLNVLLPINVFVSFINNLTLDLISNLFGVLLLAIVVETALFMVTSKKFPKFNEAQMCVARYGILVANGGLIGTPVIEGILGGIGVMYCNVFMIPTRILAYSAGESIFNPNAKKSLKDTVMNFLLNKVFIAIILAFILVSLNIVIPAPVFTAFSKIGGSLTPLSLILVGSMLADKLEFSKDVISKVVVVNIIRLIIIPSVCFALCLLLKLDLTQTTVITLLMGMPCGSTSAVFAKKYKGDTAFASMCVFSSTILSTFTLIGVMRIIELIL